MIPDARSDENPRSRPLKRVRLTLLVAFVLAQSCVVPVDIPRPGPGDAGLNEDAGTNAEVDAGVYSGPCSVPENLGFFLAGTTRTLNFPGCAGASFSSEPGVVVVTQANADRSATVRITPSTLGAWVLTIAVNGNTQTRELITDEEFNFDAGFVVRYPDRIDGLSSRRSITPSGRLLVATDAGRVEILGRNGGYEQTLHINEDWLVWAGDTLWTLRSGTPTPTVDRWRETATGLVSTGSYDATGWQTCFLCRATEDSATAFIGDDLVEFSWDGGVFSRELRTPALRIPSYYIGQLLIPEPPETVWLADGCRYEPGCTTMVCGAIRTCEHAQIVTATRQHALVNTGLDQLQLWELPLSGKRMLHARPGAALYQGGLVGSKSPAGSIDSPVLVRGGRWLAEPVFHRNRILYLQFPGWPAGSTDDGSLVNLTITKHWVTVPVSPRELRFIPR